MSKVEQILAHNGHVSSGRLRRAFHGSRTRLMMVALIGLLTAFVFFTQPQVVEGLKNLFAG